MNKTMIVAFEGIDGSGKSTALREVSNQLTLMGIAHESLSENRYNEIAQQIFGPIRDNADDLEDTVQQLLIHAMRRYVDITVIAPALAEGKVVLVDRYHLSTLVYQSNTELTRELKPIAVPEPRPVAYFVFDLPAKTAMLRMAKRGGPKDAYDDQPLKRHEERRRRYLNFAMTEPGLANYVRILDATLTPSELAFQIVQEISAMLQLK